MPRGNGTGPMGMGPMTGRGMGSCVVEMAPGIANPTANRGQGFGRGMGRGRGRGCGQGRGMGRGRGWGAVAAPSASVAAVPYDVARESRSEVEMLKDQAKYFGESLEKINRRIAEIEKEEK